MLIALTLALSARAATWTAEDLVTAHARGLPPSAVAGILDSVDRNRGTAVYLLRRGVPEEVIQGWGIPVTAAEAAAVLRLGALAEATRGQGGTVPPGAAEDVDEAISEHVAWWPETTQDPYRRTLRTRGQLGIVAGALLGVAGGVTLAFGARGGVDGAEAPEGPPGPTLAFSNAYGAVTVEPHGPDVPLMMLGGVGFAVGLGTLHFGMGQIELAGGDRDLPASVYAGR